MAKAKKDTINKEEMAANYGWALSFLKSHKELWKLFNTAVKKNYSVNRFVAALRNTKWFKTHGEAYRQSEVLRKTDPGTYNQRMQTLVSKVADMAAQSGSNVSSSIVKRIASNSMWFGWDEGQIRGVLANYIGQMGNSGHYGGEAGKAEQELRNYAYNMGVTIGDGSLKNWLKDIIAQRQTTDDFKGYLQHQAELSFPTLADKIKAGVTVRDLANPYIQQMSQTLELDDASIGLDDPTIRKALQSTGPDGKFESKPIWQFESDLKKDPRWMMTNNARSSLVGTGQQILKDFGFHF